MVLQLRGELELELEPGDVAGALRDPLFDRVVTLGPTGVAVALALEEPRDLDEALAMVAAGGFPRDQAENTLRLFAMLHLLDGIGDNVRAKIRGVWAGYDELEHVALPGARHACQGSSLCCRSYRLGPVEPEEAEVIRALPLRDAMPDLSDEEPFVRMDGHLFLRTVDAHCLFLQSDHRCGLHAHFGEDTKPLACRQYPIQMKATFREIRVFNNHQCASHFVSQAAGPPLVAAARLTGKTETGELPLFHPIVYADEETAVDYVQFLELEDALRVAIAAGPPLVQLAHAPAIVDSFVAVARALPLGVDPEPHFTAWRTSVALVSPSVVVATAADRDDALALFDALVDQLLPFVAAPQHQDRDELPLMSELLPILAALQLRTQKIVPGAAAPALEEPFASALTTSLVQRFTGTLSLGEDRPLSAIGQAALALACAFAGARERTLESLGRPHAIANRVLSRATRTLFRVHPELVRALVRVLPAICAP